LKPNANFVTIINQSIAAWEQVGITPQQVTRLQNASYTIGTLNSGLLGESSGNNVLIDATAQGHGWSESSTPQPGQMDLFTALEHEMGHLLGLPDQTTQPNDLMFESLAPGVRKTPTTQDVDAVFVGQSK
jgi:large repetitive protein